MPSHADGYLCSAELGHHPHVSILGHYSELGGASPGRGLSAKDFLLDLPGGGVASQRGLRSVLKGLQPIANLIGLDGRWDRWDAGRPARVTVTSLWRPLPLPNPRLLPTPAVHPESGQYVDPRWYRVGHLHWALPVPVSV